MKASCLVLVAALLVGCGAGNQCLGEHTAVEGLRRVVADAEEHEEEEEAALARATLQAAERALESCQERAAGDWLFQIIELFVKVAISRAER